MKDLNLFSDLVYTKKNIVNKVQIAAGFVFNERIDLSLFKLGHEYVCVCRGI